jgi:hypothetical protein
LTAGEHHSALQWALHGVVGVWHRVLGVSPTWIWMQVAIVSFVVVGGVIAIVKLV